MKGDYETISVDVTDRIGTVTLDRSDEMNALNKRSFRELSDAFETFDEMERSGDLGVVTVRGSGGNFSAGFDLSEVPSWEDQTPREIWMEFVSFHDAYRRIEQLSVPVIAAVNGYCLAAGLELAISCDFIVAKDDAVFAFPESQKGLAMDFGGAQKLPGIIGESNAMYLILTAESIDAELAHMWGLVQEVVDGESFEERIVELQETLASYPTYALGFNKDEVLSTRPDNIDEAMKVGIAYAVAVAKEERTQALVREFL